MKNLIKKCSSALATTSFFVGMLGLLPLSASAATWYVRTDGGDITQCTGHTDAPYPGAGTGQDCAVNHLFWLFPPPAKTPLISGGDTVIIGSGQYMMGINAIGDQAPNTGSCAGGTGTFTCMMAAIPSGPDAAHPTTIIGKNWDTKATPPPEFWGAGRVDHIFNLTGSNNVVMRYLDITDHAQCGYNFTANPSLMCNRTVAPYGYQADYGIYALDSSNVLLQDVDLHGLSVGALHAGRLTDWTFDSVKIEGNAFNGWNGDVGHGAYGSGTDSSMHGTITIKNSKVNYNGCVESFPLTGVYPDITIGGCYGQGQGGYGDGLGMYYTEGDWIIQDTEIMHNTQDGLDLLYHTGQIGTITINRVRAEGNAGQQLKFGASANVDNSAVVGNCNFFYNNPIATQAGFPHCRAAGTAIQTAGWRSGHYITLTNSTIVGPNKTFIEVGTAASVANAGGTGNTTGSAASIIYDSQFAVNQSQDTIWVRWAGNYNPNNGQIIARWNNYVNKVTLTGTWIPDGDGIYHLTGLGAQTGGAYVFNDIVRAYVCDGTERFVSRNNIFLGMEWWSASTKALVPGTYSDLVYLDGWDGNGAGSCAATNPVVLDNSNSIVYNTKTSLCPNSNDVLCVDPLFTNIPPISDYNDIWTYGDKWNVVPLAGSQALDQSSSAVGTVVLGNAVVPSLDIMKNLRPNNGKITWGAYDPNATSIDTAAPVVAISAPFNNATVSGMVPLAVSASDDFGVTQIELFLDGSLQTTGYSAQFNYSWDTTVLTNGSHVLSAIAYDAAGNHGQSTEVTVLVSNDKITPAITAFTMPTTSTSLTVPISSLAATDNVGVTGYLVVEGSTPPVVSATGWSLTAPTSITFSSPGTKTAYAWAKDAAGNLSNGLGKSVAITIPDTTAPTVSAFLLPSTATTLTVAISSLTATDNIGVIGYLVTESALAPLASDTRWTTSPASSFTFTSTGSKTAYAWAKDAAGNVSASRSASVTIALSDTTAPTVSTFTLSSTPTTLPSTPTTLTLTPTTLTLTSTTLTLTSTTLTVPVSNFTATDNVGVTGYMVTESALAPDKAATGWASKAPTSFTFSSAGSKTAYAWAKDAAGNVSASRSASVTITLPDTVAPNVSMFALPLTSTTLVVPVSSFAATDNVAVTGYMITESAIVPDKAATGWSSVASSSYTFSTTGTKTLYAWAKDAAGNVSTAKAATIVISVPKTVSMDVMVVSSSTTFPSIQDAYNTVPESGTIAAKDVTLSEELNFNRAVNVNLAGGMDASFQPTTGTTAVSGVIKISSGKVVVSKIVIR